MLIDEVYRVRVAVGVGGEPGEFLSLWVNRREPLEGGDIVPRLEVVFDQGSSSHSFLAAEKVAVA